jgi:hypothetical protein
MRMWLSPSTPATSYEHVDAPRQWQRCRFSPAVQGERVAEGPEGRSSGSHGAFAASHPALRATFSPLRGEKEYVIR